MLFRRMTCVMSFDVHRYSVTKVISFWEYLAVFITPKVIRAMTWTRLNGFTVRYLRFVRLPQLFRSANLSYPIDPIHHTADWREWMQWGGALYNTCGDYSRPPLPLSLCLSLSTPVTIGDVWPNISTDLWSSPGGNILNEIFFCFFWTRIFLSDIMSTRHSGAIAVYDTLRRQRYIWSYRVLFTWWWTLWAHSDNRQLFFRNYLWLWFLV
jgi:hypothetical protein